MIMYQLICSVLITTCVFIQARTLIPHHIQKKSNQELVETFLRVYGPPPEVCEILEKNESLLEMSFCDIPELPGFVIKSIGGPWPIDTTIEMIISRVINAERMRECIRRNNLTSLDVAQEYIYRKQGQWYVVSKKIEKIQDNPEISLAEIHHITILALETGYSDWSENNWFRDSRHKLVCIDTEDRSFTAYGALPLVSHYHVMLPEAIAWLEPKLCINAYHQSQPLSSSFAFDPAGINFEVLKRHIRQEYRDSYQLPA